MSSSATATFATFATTVEVSHCMTGWITFQILFPPFLFLLLTVEDNLNQTKVRRAHEGDVVQRQADHLGRPAVENGDRLDEEEV